MGIGQEVENNESDSSNSTISPFTQVGLITNRTLMTFEDNPALAGFDRKLNVSYQYSAQNLAIGVPNDDGDLVLAFQQHSAMFDMAFGEQKNWGAGVSYRNIQEGLFNQHKITWAHSYRIKMKDHSLIFGINIGVNYNVENYEAFIFVDEIDPRRGFIYPTNEITPTNEAQTLVFFGTGIRHNWKRLSVDVSYQDGPHRLYSYKVGVGDQRLLRSKLEYVIRLGPQLNLAPAVRVQNDRDDNWAIDPAISLLYKNSIFVQLSSHQFNQMKLVAGYFFRNNIGFTASFSSYLNNDVVQALGAANVSAGIRYQLNRTAQ